MLLFVILLLLLVVVLMLVLVVVLVLMLMVVLLWQHGSCESDVWGAWRLIRRRGIGTLSQPCVQAGCIVAWCVCGCCLLCLLLLLLMLLLARTHCGGLKAEVLWASVLVKALMLLLALHGVWAAVLLATG